MSLFHNTENRVGPGCRERERKKMKRRGGGATIRTDKYYKANEVTEIVGRDV